MAAFILTVSCGDIELGTVTQNANTKRWEIHANGRLYSWRDPEGAAEALQLLNDNAIPPMPF